jgi:hypothetical protein
MFYAGKGTADGLRGDCKQCFAERAAKRYRDDPEKVKRRVRQWRIDNAERYLETQRRNKQTPEGRQRDRDGHLRRAHGITQADYEGMVEAQHGRCKICGRVPRKSFHIDHDHVTGRIRGLLCSACNHALGLFAESPQRLQRAAEYVTRPDAQAARLARQRLQRELLRKQ